MTKGERPKLEKKYDVLMREYRDLTEIIEEASRKAARKLTKAEFIAMLLSDHDEWWERDYEKQKKL